MVYQTHCFTETNKLRPVQLFIHSFNGNKRYMLQIKFNLLKTLLILGCPSRYFERPLLFITGVYKDKEALFNVAYLKQTT